MKVLITGSSGYFGRLMVSHFISSGRDVAGIDIVPYPEQEDGGLFRFYNCNITDRVRMREIFRHENPTAVLHFASTFNRVRNRKKEYEVDIGGSMNILELCNETPSVRHLVYSSSAAIYGCDRNNSPWLKETDPINPGRYRYGMNKKMVEHLYFSSPRRAGLQVVSLRICTVVGPLYAKPRSVVSLLIKVPWFPKAFRENKVQFIHESDFVSLVSRVLDDRQIEGIYNLASDSYSVVKDIRPDKRFVSFPVKSLKPILWVLWNMRLLNLQPAGLTYCFFPIILDPAKLVSRYDYKFSYNSTEAFKETVMNNKLPANSRF